jgi:glucose/mannose-6-phosphate isomerase
MESPMDPILDDAIRIAEIDKKGMCNLAERFPEQCQDAIIISKAFRIPTGGPSTGKLGIKYVKPKNVIVVGMGGSAIGGSLLKDWLRDSLPIPLEVCRGYDLPAYANEETLVLAVSYSGNTEETLSSYLQAIEQKCMIVAVTSGGLLEKFSENLGIPLVKLPQGYPPRSAIGYLFFPLVYSLKQLQLINPEIEIEIDEAIAVIHELRDELKPKRAASHNPAKKLAIAIKESVPFIATSNLYRSVALRMKTQFNENSKTLAKVEVFPELNHNETVGWTELKSLHRNFSVILIRDDREPVEIKTRIEETKKLVFNGRAHTVLEVKTKGRKKLARIFSALYVGDFTSIYLAILSGIDPTPVTIIDELKKRLEKTVSKRDKLKARFERLATR